MMMTSSTANPVPAAASTAQDISLRNNSCRYNNSSDNIDTSHRQFNGNNAVNSGNKISISDYIHRSHNNGESMDMYYQANYQQLSHGHVCRPGNEETIIRHVSKIEVSCDNVSSVPAISGNSFYRSNHVEGQCADKNIVMKLVSPYRDSSELSADAGSVAYPHYEDHLIARYSQHQISSSSNLQAPQFTRCCPRITPLRRASPPSSGNCSGHASSPEPSVSPPTGVDRSSSNGSCVSSLSEPVAGGGSSGSSRRLTSYHGKKKVLDLEETAVNIGAFAQRYALAECRFRQKETFASTLLSHSSLLVFPTSVPLISLISVSVPKM
jgi:hypothetical protein